MFVSFGVYSDIWSESRLMQNLHIWYTVPNPHERTNILPWSILLRVNELKNRTFVISYKIGRWKITWFRLCRLWDVFDLRKEKQQCWNDFDFFLWFCYQSISPHETDITHMQTANWMPKYIYIYINKIET